jgi:pectinesterase
MASKLISLLVIAAVLPFFSSPSLANVSPSSLVSPGTLCNDTPDPSYCKSVLPKQSTNVYDSARLCVRKSLSQSRTFLNLVDKYLLRRSSLSITATRALEDCRFLANLNIDFLLSSFQTVNATSKTLPALKADDVQTLLSAILTNQETCLDGLQATSSAWSVRNGLSVPLSDDAKLYSVSLAFFTKGWVPKMKKRITWQPKSKQLAFRQGRLPFKMSARNHAIYESVSRRKLLQAENNDVEVSDIVTVRQDGQGNFTTINDAIAAAPNKTDGSNGYFMIYVTAGIYEEYVSIAKNKRYLMMVGDGINQTVITGNRSVVDGWTTFNSATFGKSLIPSTWS